MVHLFGGAPEAGKSTLISQIISSAVDGMPFPVAPWATKVERKKPEDFGILIMDRTRLDTLLWLDRLDLVDRIPVYDCLSDTDLALLTSPDIKNDPKKTPRGVLAFMAGLSKLGKKSKIIFVDTGLAVVGGDAHKNERVWVHMRFLWRLCLDQGLTIILLLYGVKTPSKQEDKWADPIERIAVGSALRGCSSSIIYLATEADTEKTGCGFQDITWTTRFGPRVTARLRRHPRDHDLSGLFYPDPDFDPTSDPLAGVSGLETQAPVLPAEEIVAEIVARLPASSAALKKALTPPAGPWPKSTFYYWMSRLREGRFVTDDSATGLVQSAVTSRAH